MSILYELKHLFGRALILKRIAKARPMIVLGKSGQLTDQPHVHLSIDSAFGTMGIFTEPDTEQGNALVKLHSMTLANLTGLPVYDGREVATRGVDQVA